MKYCKIFFLLIIVLSHSRNYAQDSLVEKNAYYNGIVNVVPDGHDKFLIGMVNISKGNQKCFQNGIVNYNQKNLSGIQLSIFNFVGGNVGLQIGVMNINMDTLRKAQIGFFNATKVNNGLQLGIVNYSDTINKGGSAWSFLTIVRRGGYYALEYYVSEMLPINTSFKLGLSKRHNAIHLSTDANFKTIFIGGGLCVMAKLNERWFFNPEFSMQSAVGKTQKIISLCPKFTYALHKRIYFSVGPSVVWNRSKIGDLNSPLYAIYEGVSANGNNKLVVGIRAGLRFNIIN
jgi:hypothetical protein